MSVHQHPKFIMEVGRQQPVPKLISINDVSSTFSTYNQHAKRQNISKSIRQRTPSKIAKKTHNNFFQSRQQLSQTYENYQTYSQTEPQQQFISNNFNSNFENSVPFNNEPSIQQSSYFTTMRKQLPVTEPKNYRIEVIQLQKMLQIEKEEKLQLQQIIKELTIKSQKLQQVNQHIVQRLKEIQKNFVQQKIQQQKQIDQRVRKAVNQVYSDVSKYLTNQVSQLTNKLKNQKMNPLLQKKLQLFMESILQINQNTVQMSKYTKSKKAPPPQNILTQFLSKKIHEKQNLNLSSLHFNQFSINHQNQDQSYMSKSSIRKKSASPNQDKRLINNAYITSYKKKSSPPKFLTEYESRKQDNENAYNKILKKLQNIRQGSKNYEIVQPENHSQQEADEGHISFIDHFKAQVIENKLKMRNSNQMSQSFMDRKHNYDSAYANNSFIMKEYTPNKRKKIFDGAEHSKSKSKIRNYQK